MRIPDEAKLWFVDFHAYQARVHGKSLAYNIRQAKHLVPELFGPVAPDTFRRWHDGGALDHRGRPPVDLPLFALSRLANLTHAVTARLSLSVPTWQRVYRRVLRELDVEFEPKKGWTKQFLHSLQLSWKLAATCSRSRPSEASAAARHLPGAIASKSHRIACGTRTRQLCAWFQKSRVSPCLRLARLRHGHARGEHEGRHVDADRLRGEDRPSAAAWTTLSAPARVPLPDAQEAFLNMIDAIDPDMHARAGDAELTPWLLLLDCAPQHVAAEFRSTMRGLPAAHQIVLRPPELQGIHSGAGQGVHARPQELDPPRGGQTLRRVLLGSRVQLRTCQSGLQHIGAPTAAALIRAHSRTERRQPTTSSCWPALDRLERGGAA